MEKQEFAEGGQVDLLEQCLQALHEKDRLSFAGKFVQGFVHNTNGPLQNLSMLTEMLIAGMDLQDRLYKAREDDKWAEALEKQKKRLTQMRDQIYGLAGTLREFMQLLEIERNSTDIDINGLLAIVLRVFRSNLFFKHRVTPELKLQRNLPLARIPGCNIIPVLFHLVQNAVTAIENSPRKELTVETALEDDHIVIRITDSGCGLSGCDPESLFGLFESKWPDSGQGENSVHLGFGLYAARMLLLPYNCTVNLESSSDGTSSIVRIPVSK